MNRYVLQGFLEGILIVVFVFGCFYSLVSVGYDIGETNMEKQAVNKGLGSYDINKTFVWKDD